VGFVVLMSLLIDLVLWIRDIVDAVLFWIHHETSIRIAMSAR
jgi:hypothetical protein